MDPTLICFTFETEPEKSLISSFYLNMNQVLLREGVYFSSMEEFFFFTILLRVRNIIH